MIGASDDSPPCFECGCAFTRSTFFSWSKLLVCICRVGGGETGVSLVYLASRSLPYSLYSTWNSCVPLYPDVPMTPLPPDSYLCQPSQWSSFNTAPRGGSHTVGDTFHTASMVWLPVFLQSCRSVFLCFL